MLLYIIFNIKSIIILFFIYNKIAYKACRHLNLPIPSPNLPIALLTGGLLWFIGWLSCAPRFHKILAAASVLVKFIEQKNFNS